MAEFLKEKQFGDSKRIASIINAKRTAKGEPEVPYGTIRSMLNGNRKMSKEVKEIAQAYFEKQQELQTI